MWNPQKIPYEKVKYLSTSPVKCSHGALKNSKKSFSTINHLEYLQLQLNKFSAHEITLIFSLIRNSNCKIVLVAEWLFYSSILGVCFQASFTKLLNVLSIYCYIGLVCFRLEISFCCSDSIAGIITGLLDYWY